MSETLTVEIGNPEIAVIVENERAVELFVTELQTELQVVAAGNVGVEGGKGDKGDKGNPGPPGQGVPVGGTTGQSLTKKSGTDYDTEWTTITGGGGGAPSGPAGGDLSGTYPNPSVVDDSHAHTGATISALDTGDITTGTFVIGRIPTGTTGTTVALGNDSRFTDSRPPNGTAGGDLSGTYPNPAVVDDSHAHTGTTISALDASDTTTGTFAIGRIPTGTTSSTVALGNHLHGGVYDPAGTASSAITTHEAAADPHTGYQRESEKAAVNGYASLDGTTKVPIAQVPTGTSGTTVALGNHLHAGVYDPAGTASTAVANHAAAADPHTGYQLESEKAQVNGYASLDATGKVPAAQLPATGGGNVEVYPSTSAPGATAYSVIWADTDDVLPPSGSGSGGAPSGPAGGDLTGTYPNPTLAADRVKKTGDTMSGALVADGMRIGTSSGYGANYKSIETSGVPAGGGHFLFGIQAGGDRTAYLQSNEGSVVLRPNNNVAAQFEIQNSLTIAGTPIQLPADPSSAMHAATKQYVDGKTASGTAGGDLTGTYPNPTLAVDRVKKTGDTMTGDLAVNSNSITIDSPGTAFMALDKNADANFAQFEFRTNGTQDFAIGTAGTGATRRLKIYSAGTGFDELNIDRATGAVTVRNDPTSALGVATKQYVDARTPKVTSSTTAPSSPATGDIWVDMN